MPRSTVASVLVGSSLLVLLGALGCGSVTAQNDAGSPGTAGSGAGGSKSGTAGAQGTAGVGGAGSGVAGSGGAGSGAAGSGTGGSGVAGSGAAGSGHAGAGGGTAGAGGTSSDGGVKDGGVSACMQATMFDRSCTVDADCVAVTHQINCCGSAVWLGIRVADKPRYDEVETACDRSYPGCGCASGPPTTDDGSVVPFGTMGAGVTCQAGTCKTFAKACGHPCDTGRSCTTCMSPDAGSKSVCSLRCMGDTTCTEPLFTKCQVSFAGGVCVDPTRACGPL
jgi:hypothetical protein